MAYPIIDKSTEIDGIDTNIGAMNDVAVTTASDVSTIFQYLKGIIDASGGGSIVVKGEAFTLLFPLLDSDNNMVTGTTNPDSEISKDSGAFADCTNEATEIGSTGWYTLGLTTTETNATYIAIQVKSDDAQTALITVYTSS